MQVKILEIRDRGTFIPALCVDINPDRLGLTQQNLVQRFYMRRLGYPCDGRPNIIMTHLTGGYYATNDPYGWPRDTRTFPVAHNYIIENWEMLHDGDVVDVEFILKETKEPKLSERYEPSAEGYL